MVKCIEDEIPFDVPEGWEWSKINFIAFVTKLAGFEYTKSIVPNLCDTGIPLFKGKNIQNSQIIYEFESFIPKTVSDELNRSQINRKCILTPYVGTIGNIGIHNKVGTYHLGSNVGKIELYNQKVTFLEEYVVFYLQSSYGYKQLTKHMKATAQASISIEAIRDVYIPIPPTKEQIRLGEYLANVLDFLDNIEKNKIDISSLIKQTKSKILDLAIRGQLVPQDPNDEPASALLERIRAEKEELIKQGKIKRNKKESVIFKGDDNSYYEKIGNEIHCIDVDLPFSIPYNWTWCRGKDCFSGMQSRKPQGSLFKYIDIDAIDNHNHCIKSPKVIETSKAPSRASRAVFCGSVLFSLVRPYLQNIAFISSKNEDCIASTGFYVCTSTGTFLPEYMYYLMLSPYVIYGLNQYMKGDNSPSIKPNNIEEWLYPVPPLEEQKRIVNYIDKLMSFITKLDSNIT